MGRDDETWDPDATVVPDGGPAAAAPDDRLVGRYEVGRLLGRGGSGQVHAAHDTVLDQPVAIKFVRALGSGAVRQLRRELTALRVLAVPGVVRLHDDGTDQGQTFLVMDLLPGGPFDGLAQRGGWDTWREEARALLETLARVHFAGVIHRDLKPENVLLHADGRPVITDFGLAQGRTVEDPTGGLREGTPRYMAPEQRRGGVSDARTDLYALGGMFWEMLTGCDLPSDPMERGLDGYGVPDDVAAVVMAMLAEHPGDRPEGVVDVLERLFGDAPAVLGPADLGLPDVAEPEQLQALFDEPQPSFLHLAEDAAAELHTRTGGVRAAVRAELDRWARAGLVWWNGELVHIERPAIEQLRWERDPERARLAELARDDPDSFAEAALEFAERTHRAGSAERAFAVLEAAILASDDPPSRTRLIDLLAAVASDLMEHLDRVLHHATRHSANAAASLAHAAEAQRLSLWHQVLEHANAALAHESPSTRRPSLAFRVRALRAVDPSALLELLGPSARGSELPEVSWHAGHAQLCYDRGRYEAAREHLLAAAGAADRLGTRLSGLTNAAAAALEVPDPDTALTIVAESRALLTEAVRLPLVEARLHWIARTSEYRRGTATAQNAEAWIKATQRVLPSLAAQLALTEAAICWRAGDAGAGARLAGQAASLFEQGSHHGWVLSQALVAACGSSFVDATVTRQARALPMAEIALQALALLKLGGLPVECANPVVQRARDARTRATWASRLDVLSLDEAARILSS